MPQDRLLALYRWIVGLGLAGLIYFAPAAPVGGAEAERLDRQHQAILEKLDRLEREVSLGNLFIGELDREIEKSGSDLAGARSELEVATREVEAKQAVLVNRLQGVYRQSDTLTLEILFSSRNFSELIAAAAFLARIADADARLVSALKKEQERKETFARLLSQRKADLIKQREERQELIHLVQGNIAKEEALLARINREMGFASSQPGKAVKGIAVRATSFGHASWYGNQFHGRRTANGEIFNQNAFTAASPRLAFGTLLRVTYGGRQVVVRINDRGPFVRGRVLDLSRAAARQLGLGVGYVRMEVLGRAKPSRAAG